MKKIVTILLSMIFLGSYGYAEKINRLLVDEQTLKNNPSIAAAKLVLDNAKQAYRSSFSSFFPDLAFSGGYSQDKSEKRGYNKNYSYGLTASLSIFSGFEACNDVKKKVASLKVAQAKYDRSVSDVMYEARLRYLDLMWAYETFKLLAQIKDRRTENRDLIKLKYNSGKVDIGSLMIEESYLAMADHSLRSEQRRIETASAALIRAIGRNDDAVILETDEKIPLEQVILKPDYNSLITTIPEFLVVKYEQNVSKISNAMAKGQFLPSAKINGGVGGSDNKWPKNFEDWKAELEISCPLFDGGKKYRNVKITSNNLKIASETLKNTISELKAKAVQHYNELIDAQENIEIKTYCLNASKLQAEISSKKYVNGLSTYSDWNKIEDNYIISQKELLDAKKTAAQFRISWDKFLGKGFTNDKDRGE